MELPRPHSSLSWLFSRIFCTTCGSFWPSRDRTYVWVYRIPLPSIRHTSRTHWHSTSNLCYNVASCIVRNHCPVDRILCSPTPMKYTTFLYKSFIKESLLGKWVNIRFPDSVSYWKWSSKDQGSLPLLSTLGNKNVFKNLFLGWTRGVEMGRWQDHGDVTKTLLPAYIGCTSRGVDNSYEGRTRFGIFWDGWIFS